MVEATCPHCQSENTQAIQVLLAAGTTRGTFHGGGVSLSQGGGLGAHSLSGSTTQSTVLVQRFAMPKRPAARITMLLSGILLGGLGTVIMFPALGAGETGSTVGCGGGIAVMGGVLLGIYFLDLLSLADRQARWDQRAQYLRHAWFCHRCGSDWLPNPTGAH